MFTQRQGSERVYVYMREKEGKRRFQKAASVCGKCVEWGGVGGPFLVAGLQIAGQRAGEEAGPSWSRS